MSPARAVDARSDREQRGRGAGGGRGRNTRRALVALAAGSLLLVATACSSNGGTGAAGAAAGGSSASATAGAGSGASPSASANSAAVVTISPKNDSTGVNTNGALKVSAATGKLTTVKVASADGADISGTIATDGSSWKPAGALRSGTKYTVAATAVDSNGLSVTEQSSFTTMTPSNTNIGNFNVDPGATYGVGMEVSITFTPR